MAVVPVGIVGLFCSFLGNGEYVPASGFPGAWGSGPRFPYKKAGLTERQAAAHLLNRFTYGARPGQVDEVVKKGLEKWFMEQLNAGLPEDSLNRLLSGYDVLTLSNEEIVKTYPKNGLVMRMAVRDGIIDKDSVDRGDKKEYRALLDDYMQQKGLKPEKELFRQFINQKILRAAYTHNQLQEVLADFWFNHFNVSITKNDCSQFIPDYERDVIRPNALGKFEDLLMATAKSPAMLFYLDNFSSAGTNSRFANRQMLKGADRQAEKEATGQMEKKTMVKGVNGDGLPGNGSAGNGQGGNEMKGNRLAGNGLPGNGVVEKRPKKAPGLNENYAREVMELHTLGVDGGYTQEDVTQVARVLTGWTIYPMGEYGNGARKLIETTGEDRLKQGGFVHDGDFLFTPNRHDNGEKTILGRSFAANGGYEEGVELLKMLAHHPSTAKFISKKIAVRFVSDNPPQSLIDKMAKTFTEKDGDIRQVLLTMVNSPEFWNRDAFREKIKSPFELAISSVRSLDASITMPYPLYTWITKMGQKLYYYQAPTGFPDKGPYWINTGALLYRMNFGLALASQRIPGISFSLAALNNNHEPESTGAALMVYGKLLLPERALDETIKRLTPLLNDPNLDKKIGEAAGRSAVAGSGRKEEGMAGQTDGAMMEYDNGSQPAMRPAGQKKTQPVAPMTSQPAMGVDNNPMLSQVVGIIIGSPEFQRK